MTNPLSAQQISLKKQARTRATQLNKAILELWKRRKILERRQRRQEQRKSKRDAYIQRRRDRMQATIIMGDVLRMKKLIESGVAVINFK